ncbi:MAG: hypothetical protein AAGB34_07910 [Planctomycetota bacterium]
MPGPQGVRRILTAAANISIDPILILQVEKALGDLETLVSREIGTWQDLGAALAGWLPEAREEFELGNRQIAYRAMANLKGKSAEMLIILRLAQLAPDDPEHLDTVSIFGLVQFKRIRVGTPVRFSRTALTSTEYEPVRGITGGPSPVLTEFCSKPTPEFTTKDVDDQTQFELIGDEVGVGSLADIYITDIQRSNKGSFNNPLTASKDYVAVSSVNMPVRTLVFDAIINNNIIKNFEPEPLVYDTGAHGPVDPRSPRSRGSQIDTIGQIQKLSNRPGDLRIGEVARYTEMVDYVFNELGWDRSHFQAYRWRVEFPLVASQYTMVFS